MHLSTWLQTTTWFLSICQNKSQRHFKNFQRLYEGYIRRTELNQTSTYTKKLVSNRNDVKIYSPLRLKQHWFWKSLVRSWCFRKSNSSTKFKHLQGPSDTDSMTFINHVCFQGLSRPWKSGRKNSRTFKVRKSHATKCLSRVLDLATVLGRTG